MPRATRAAHRAQEFVEEATTAAAIALPATPVKERVPLGEISNNLNATSDMAVTGAQVDMEEKPAVKGKKGKGGRKGKKGAKAKAADKDAEVLEDENQSSQSDAVEEACSELMNNAAAPGRIFVFG